MEFLGKNQDTSQTKQPYGNLLRRFTFLTVVCSVVPLLLVGWGLNIHHTYFSTSRITRNFEERAQNHRETVEAFLKEQSSKLRLIAYTHNKNFLTAPGNLQTVFENMNREYQTITDLGVIDYNGRHLAYVGPYDLLNKNYAETAWFREVMKSGLHISDMFTGFREKPHFIIAVRRSESEGDLPWILRATVNTEIFREMVEHIRVGETGEVFLVNSQGIYQTSPKYDGNIMDKSPVNAEFFEEPVKIGIHRSDFTQRLFSGNSAQSEFTNQIVAKSWLDDPKWMLVIKQDYSEAFADFNHSQRINLFFLHISAISILIASIFTTRHMIRIIKDRDDHANQLNAQLLQTGKLASIGELAAGVAHEINNPVAIIMTERQILLDQYKQSHIEDMEFRNQFSASMDQIVSQAKRCKRITHNLLRFARRTHSMIESIDLNKFILEVVELMGREAKTSGIKFLTELDDQMPSIQSDASQLQQVFLNLFTNAIDAHESKPYGTIRITSKYDQAEAGIEITVADTGCGLSEENINRIFDPFYTTKPVGKGTGLGLSICYTIIKNLGGNITVHSEKGQGTEFIIFLPMTTPVTESEE